MFESKDQLRHRMALALSQIVVVSRHATTGISLAMKGEGLIKFYDDLYKHSFGNYRDVLKSAAMSYFLTFLGNKKEDNVTNTAPDENYAREFMQLFSIGIYKLNLNGTKVLGSDGNPTPSYTQEDVSELAKVFTGWDWYSSVQDGEYGDWGRGYGNDKYYIHNLIHDNKFTSKWHEYGEKKVLGQTIEAGLDGEADIDRAIDILMSNPNMAPHVSRHLIMRLVTSNPSSAYIARVASVFNDNGQGIKGDLKATLEAILLDDEARGVTVPDNFGKIDEFLLAFTHYSSRFNVKALPFISHNGEKIYNRYKFRWFLWVKHLPLTANSVFNFYTNEDAPNDRYFQENNLVAPEFTTRSDSRLKKFMELTKSRTYDSYEVVELNATRIAWSSATTMEEWLEMSHVSVGLMYNSQDVYEYFLPIWKRYWNLSEKERKEGVGKLVDFLAIKLLGKELPAFYREEIIAQIHIQANPVTVVQEVTRDIVNSSYFMVLD
jgi:hypothetical protein